MQSIRKCRQTTSYICPLWECENTMAHSLYVMTWERLHYNDVIMSTMSSQITSLTIVCSAVNSRCRSRTTSKHHVTGVCAGNTLVTGEFSPQRASNAENVSIWWRHHGITGPFEFIHKGPVPIEYETHNLVEHRLCAVPTVYDDTSKFSSRRPWKHHITLYCIAFTHIGCHVHPDIC